MDDNTDDLASLRIERSAQREFLRKPRRARRIVVVAILVLLLAGVFFLLRPLLFPGVEVRLATASYNSPAQLQAVLTASGYVVALRKAAVASKGTGQLVYLGVQEGDDVKKGQVIARLDDKDVVAALERAKENLRLAEADLNEAKQNLERQKVLLEKTFIAPAEYDAAEARYKRVLASIAAARAAVKEAEAAVENTRITAPFDGTVLSKNADIGEIVAPLAGAASSRAAVVTIADLSSLELEADVSEANIPRVFANQPCEITLDAYPERRYPGYVEKIVPTADRAKATVMVKVKFKSYDRRVLPEMSAKVNFLPEGLKNVEQLTKLLLTVPDSAVAARNGKNVVYQVRDGRAVEVPVVLGQRIGNQVEITEGLKAGDKVIASADEKIRPGTRVVVKAI
ncbi:MAG TPA: efflux RND transporter periplasmic adaptor subunit [Candidatus Binatia bacterium]|nr:efflux RND transporter periplasmic adaptor subunit [Candidatus Binatia bacterium]